MQPARKHILGVAARALLMLPFLLAAWYFAGAGLTLIAAKGASPIISSISDGRVATTPHAHGATYAVRLEMPYRPGGTPRVEAEIEVGVAKFTYGIALFLALAFAAKESRAESVGIVLGGALLLVVPAFGVAFDALKQLGATQGMPPFLRWSAGTREAIALGYQVGTLLLPTLVPIALWLFLARKLWSPREVSQAAAPVAAVGSGT